MEGDSAAQHSVQHSTAHLAHVGLPHAQRGARVDALLSSDSEAGRAGRAGGRQAGIRRACGAGVAAAAAAGAAGGQARARGVVCCVAHPVGALQATQGGAVGRWLGACASLLGARSRRADGPALRTRRRVVAAAGARARLLRGGEADLGGARPALKGLAGRDAVGRRLHLCRRHVCSQCLHLLGCILGGSGVQAGGVWQQLGAARGRRRRLRRACLAGVGAGVHALPPQVPDLQV